MIFTQHQAQTNPIHVKSYKLFTVLPRLSGRNTSIKHPWTRVLAGFGEKLHTITITKNKWDMLPQD